MSWLEKKLASFVIPSADGENGAVLTKDYVAAAQVDHSLWDALLKKFVEVNVQKNGIGLNVLDYASVARDPTFVQYLDMLATVDIPSLSTNEQLALYINAYNAFTVNTVVRYCKKKKMSVANLASINDVSTRFKQVWKQDAGILGGETVSLDTIEHKRLRELYSEPRIHACIVCASVSCPDLRNEAFTAQKLDAQMDDQMTLWLRHPSKGFRIQDDKKAYYMSKIFLWFETDFKPSPIAFIKPYLTPNNRNKLVQNKYKEKFFSYDWGLNNFEG
jgi:hypothetical protein